jgi:hypothetical protein
MRALRWVRGPVLHRLVIPREADNLEDVEEEVDDVQVEVEGGEHVLLRGQRVLRTKYSHEKIST